MPSDSRGRNAAAYCSQVIHCSRWTGLPQPVMSVGWVSPLYSFVFVGVPFVPFVPVFCVLPVWLLCFVCLWCGSLG